MIKLARRKTDEEFKNEVNLKYNSEYTVLNTYNNINTILDLFLSNNYLLFNYNIYFQVNGFEIRYGIYSLDGDKYE